MQRRGAYDQEGEDPDESLAQRGQHMVDDVEGDVLVASQQVAGQPEGEPDQ